MPAIVDIHPDDRLRNRVAVLGCVMVVIVVLALTPVLQKAALSSLSPVAWPLITGGPLGWAWLAFACWSTPPRLNRKKLITAAIIAALSMVIILLLLFLTEGTPRADEYPAVIATSSGLSVFNALALVTILAPARYIVRSLESEQPRPAPRWGRRPQILIGILSCIITIWLLADLASHYQYLLQNWATAKTDLAELSLVTAGPLGWAWLGLSCVFLNRFSRNEVRVIAWVAAIFSIVGLALIFSAHPEISADSYPRVLSAVSGVAIFNGHLLAWGIARFRRARQTSNDESE